MAIYSSISFTCNISFAIFGTYKYILNIILICLMCIPNVQYTIHVLRYTIPYPYMLYYWEKSSIFLHRVIINFMCKDTFSYKFIWETTFHSSNNRFLSIKQFVSSENWWIFFLLRRFSCFLAPQSEV